MEAPGSYKPLVRRLRVNLEAAHWLIGGVFIAASSGDGLLSERAPGSPWHRPLIGVEFVATLLDVDRSGIDHGVVYLDNRPNTRKTLFCSGYRVAPGRIHWLASALAEGPSVSAGHAGQRLGDGRARGMGNATVA